MSQTATTQTFSDVMKRITDATPGPLPKCFYTLAAALAGLDAALDAATPPHVRTDVQQAIAAAACCVYEYGKSPEQREEEEGLDLAGSPGKWKAAQEYVAEHEIEAGTPGYWQAVRIHFLEIGGGFLKDMPTATRATRNTPRI